MKHFTIGRIEGTWVNFIPPIQGGNFESDSDDEGIVIEDSCLEEDTSNMALHDRNSQLDSPLT